MTILPGGSTPSTEARSNAQFKTPAASDDDQVREAREDGAGEGEGDEVIGEIHEVAANLLFILAGLHLLGVAFETRRSGRGILTAMLPGRRELRCKE